MGMVTTEEEVREPFVEQIIPFIDEIVEMKDLGSGHVDAT